MQKATIVYGALTWRWSATGVVVLVFVTVFIAILLRANPIHKIAQPFKDQLEPIVNQEKVEVTKQTVIEQPSTSDFTFQVMLKQAEVKPTYVKVYESTAKDPTKKTSHVLQVASFSSEKDAKVLQKRLIKKS